eukprot:GFUD01131945.1.p1 GENE.GFUD01131945.1~~GFUD01131945.1.p1  ORF type:complete len:113 (-),score=19.41 GFUD01131945.1:12-350(-)
MNCPKRNPHHRVKTNKHKSSITFSPFILSDVDSSVREDPPDSLMGRSRLVRGSIPYTWHCQHKYPHRGSCKHSQLYKQGGQDSQSQTDILLWCSGAGHCQSILSCKYRPLPY